MIDNYNIRKKKNFQYCFRYLSEAIQQCKHFEDLYSLRYGLKKNNMGLKSSFLITKSLMKEIK